jgi:hypothetical protein
VDVYLEDETDGDEPELQIPEGETDFFVSFATTPGYAAIRWTVAGSPFVLMLMLVRNTVHVSCC